MSSAWLRTPRLNEPEDFREHETQAEHFDAGRVAVDRFGEFMAPRPTVKEACYTCTGAGTVGEIPCSACGGKGHRNVFVDHTAEATALESRE